MSWAGTILILLYRVLAQLGHISPVFSGYYSSMASILSHRDLSMRKRGHPLSVFLVRLDLNFPVLYKSYFVSPLSLLVLVDLFAFVALGIVEGYSAC